MEYDDMDIICARCGERYGQHSGEDCPDGKGKFQPKEKHCSKCIHGRRGDKCVEGLRQFLDEKPTWATRCCKYKPNSEAKPRGKDSMKAIEALKGSIEKWDGVAKGTVIDRGPHNCPLCKEYRGVAKACKGCPIEDDTGAEGCLGTPFENWNSHMSHKHTGLPATIHCPECRSQQPS